MRSCSRASTRVPRGAATPRRADGRGRAPGAAGCGSRRSIASRYRSSAAVAVAQQCPAARFDAEREVGAAGSGRLGEPLERVRRPVGVPGAHGRLDQLGQRPHAARRVRCPRRRGGRARPRRSGRGRCRGPRPPSAGSSDGLDGSPCRPRRVLDERGGLGLPALAAPASQRAVYGGKRLPVAAATPRSPRPATRHRRDRRPRARRERQDARGAAASARRAGVADELHLRARWRRQLSLSHTSEVPANVPSTPAGRPPATGACVEKRSAPRCSVGAAAAWPSSIRSGETVEQQVERTRRPPAAGAPDSAADLQQDAPARRAAGHHRRAPRRQVGLAREIEVERLERRAAPVSSNGGASLPKPEANATWPRTRSTRARWKSSSGPPRPSPAARARRRRHRPGSWPGRRPAPARRARGSMVSATARCEERGRRGDAAAGLRPAGRALELVGDLLVRLRRAAGRDARPAGPGRSRRRWRRRGRGARGGGRRRRRAIGGRSDERVRELDAGADLEQAGIRPPGRPRPCRSRASRRRDEQEHGSPSGSAAAARTSSWVSAGSWRRRWA